MGKIVTTTLNRFDGGIVNDPRTPRAGVCRMCTNFDALTNPYKLTPYRTSEDGDSAASTSQKQNFQIALRTGTTYSLYSLGVKSGAATAEVLYKDLTTGGSNDLDDATWSTPTNNQSSSGAANFDLFLYYKTAGLIIGARAGTNLWAFSPSGSAWSDSWQALTYTNIAQGIVHSKDDIAYFPYDNKIASYNHTGTVWNATALTLPSHFYVTSICEYGNYLAIACAPLNAVGKSHVFLWDRDSTLVTLSESIDWGEGSLRVLHEIEGSLVGASLYGSNSTRFKDRVVFKSSTGYGAKEFLTLQGGTTTYLPIAKQKIDNRLWFMMSISLGGSTREGVWSIGKNEEGGFSVLHERTPNGDTALTSPVFKNFFIIGDYLFQSYVDNSAYVLFKTNDQESYPTAIYETVIFNAGDASQKKDLAGLAVSHEALASGAQVVVKYKVDEDSSWTTLLTSDTDDAISADISSLATNMPKGYKEVHYRIESTGGAVVTGLMFDQEITGGRSYN